MRSRHPLPDAPMTDALFDFDRLIDRRSLPRREVGPLRRPRRAAAVGRRHGLRRAAGGRSDPAPAHRPWCVRLHRCLARAFEQAVVEACGGITDGRSSPTGWCGCRAWSPASTSPAPSPAKRATACSPPPGVSAFLTAPANTGRVLQRRTGAGRRPLAMGLGLSEGRLHAHDRLLLLCSPHNRSAGCSTKPNCAGSPTSPRATTCWCARTRSTAAWFSTPIAPPARRARQGDRAAHDHLMAPSRTWNIPALYCAFAIIPDPRCAGATATPCAASCRMWNVLGMVAAGHTATAMPGDGAAGLPARQPRACAGGAGCDARPDDDAPEATYLAWVDLPRDDGGARGLRPGGLLRGRRRRALGWRDLPGAGLLVRLNFGCPARDGQALARMAPLGA